MNILKKTLTKVICLYWLKKKPIKFARYIGVTIGEHCRLIHPTFGTFGSEPYLVKVGNDVTIAKGVQFITHDGSLELFRKKEPLVELFSPINIGNNVFVGVNSVLLPGVIIEDNVIVGAGSIVKGVLKSNGVYAGVPAKYICSLDEFYEKNKDKYTYVRHLPLKEKHDFIKQRFR